MGRIREGTRKVNKKSGRKMEEFMFGGVLVGEERDMGTEEMLYLIDEYD